MLLALFFTLIGYPFALCVNFNGWEGMSVAEMMTFWNQGAAKTRVNQAHRSPASSGG